MPFHLSSEVIVRCSRSSPQWLAIIYFLNQLKSLTWMKVSGIKNNINHRSWCFRSIKKTQRCAWNSSLRWKSAPWSYLFSKEKKTLRIFDNPLILPKWLLSVTFYVSTHERQDFESNSVFSFLLVAQSWHLAALRAKKINSSLRWVECPP